MTTSAAPAPPEQATPIGEAPVVDNSAADLSRHNLYRKLASWINFADWIAVGLVAVISVSLHLRFINHVGALWRDEANSVKLATMPHLSDVWHCLDFDSFPLLFFAVLRLWTGIFGADDDSALRLLGLLTGLGVLAAIWISMRAFNVKTPVVSLALIGLNPMLIRYGDSTRAYGLGILLIILTFAGFWRLVACSSSSIRARIITAGALAFLSVQCLYYNAVLLVAIIAAAVAVCIRKRARGTAVIAFCLGIPAAVSLLVYVPMMVRMHEWTFLVNHPVDLRWLWQRSFEVLGSPDPLGIWVWTGLFFTSIGVAAAYALFAFVRRRRSSPDFASNGATSAAVPLPDAVLFAAVALAVAVPAYTGFLYILKYYTQPWYYITLAAFAACAMDVVVGAHPLSTRFHPSIYVRGIRTLIALGLVCLTALPVWREIATRHTNIDLVTSLLQSATVKGDVVLLPQWENGVSFARYYHGPAEIITIPDIPDHRFHRYDLFLRQMMAIDPVHRIRERLEQALRSNHSVFIAGNLGFPPPSVHLRTLAPATRETVTGLNGREYYTLWQLQIGQFLRAHGVGIAQIPVPVPDNAPIQTFEDVRLELVRGWRDP